jgi:hypothetical protein
LEVRISLRRAYRRSAEGATKLGKHREHLAIRAAQLQHGFATLSVIPRSSFILLMRDETFEASPSKIHPDHRVSAIAGVIFEQRLCLPIKQHLERDTRNNPIASLYSPSDALSFAPVPHC